LLSLDPSQVVSLIDDLERRGLVERTAGKQDRRVKIIGSTVEGRRIRAKARAALDTCEQEQLTSLADDEAVQLKELLRKALWGKADSSAAARSSVILFVVDENLP
jgi:DNA-binding MarR family transcriptional regulator